MLSVLAALLFLWSASDVLAFYNPSTGKWLSRDPVEEKGGKNLSGFVYNNSVGLVDPVGLEVIVADNGEIAVRNDYKSKRVLGPPSCLCSKTVIGTVQAVYAYAKATTSESLNLNHPGILHGIESRLNVPEYYRARTSASDFLGAGFIVDFTPNANTTKCCKKTYWKQWKLKDEWVWPWWRSVLRPDYTAGNRAADFAGDNVNIMGQDQDWRKSYLLELYCDEKVIYGISWSYRVIYKSGWPDNATVTLDVPF